MSLNAVAKRKAVASPAKTQLTTDTNTLNTYKSDSATASSNLNIAKLQLETATATLSAANITLSSAETSTALAKTNLDNKLITMNSAVSTAQQTLNSAMVINAPQNLTISSDTSTVTLDWDAPTTGVQPERYAIFFDNGTSAGWGIATGNGGDANALNTNITLSYDMFKYTGGLDSTYNFSVRSDQDTIHMYSNRSNTVSLLVIDYERVAAEEAARLAAEQAAIKAAADAAAAQAAAQAASAAAAAAEARAQAAAQAAAQAEAEAKAAEEAAAQAEAEKTAAEAEAAAKEAEAKAAEEAAAKAEAEAKAQAEADAKAEAEAMAAEKEAADQAAKDAQAKADAAKEQADKAKAEADKLAEEKAAADKKLEEATGMKSNNPDQLPEDKPKLPDQKDLVAKVQVDKAGVENGGIQFFGTKSAPQVVGEDGKLTPPAPPPGSGLPIPPDAITTTDTFIGQPGGTTFNAPDIAVPVIPKVVCVTIKDETGKEIHVDSNGDEHEIDMCIFLPAALDAIPGAGEAIQAMGEAYAAIANIGNDMSPVTRKKAKKILLATIVAGQIAAFRRRFGQ